MDSARKKLPGSTAPDGKFQMGPLPPAQYLPLSMLNIHSVKEGCIEMGLHQGRGTEGVRQDGPLRSPSITEDILSGIP